MTEARSINHMKCYLFRMAQEKWKLSAFDTVKLFKENQLFEYIDDFFFLKENQLFEYIDDCYDLLHLSSYQLALHDLETILRNRGIVIE